MLGLRLFLSSWCYLCMWLDPAGSLQGPGLGVEEGPGCCHSPVPWIYSQGCSYLLKCLETEGLLPGCHMQVKSRVVTSEEREHISRTASSLCPMFTVLGILGSGSGLSCLFSFSIALAFLIELCLAFARQEGVFFHVFVSFVAAYKTLFFSATLHQSAKKWCWR